jgi:hypothetical protein
VTSFGAVGRDAVMVGSSDARSTSIVIRAVLELSDRLCPDAGRLILL